MNKVFAVQELKRFHCPKCDGTYAQRTGANGSFVCQNSSCKHEYEQGVAKPRDSLTEAAAYGDIEVLFSGNNIGIALQPMVNQFKSVLRNFSDNDFILPTGDPVAISIASIIAARNNNGRVGFLRWDRQTRSYIKVQVTI